MYRPHKCCELEILGSEIIHQTRPSPGLKCKQEYDPGNGSMIFWFYFTSCQQSTRKEGIECFENVDIHFTNKYLRSIKKRLIQMVVCIVCNICNSSNYLEHLQNFGHSFAPDTHAPLRVQFSPSSVQVLVEAFSSANTFENAQKLRTYIVYKMTAII